MIAEIRAVAMASVLLISAAEAQTSLWELQTKSPDEMQVRVQLVASGPYRQFKIVWTSKAAEFLAGKIIFRGMRRGSELLGTYEEPLAYVGIMDVCKVEHKVTGSISKDETMITFRGNRPQFIVSCNARGTVETEIVLKRVSQ